MTAVVMTRGSQLHHTPHVGRAQIDPRRSVSPVNRTPISADATAIASKTGLLVQRYATLARNTTTNARYASHAFATWTYRIRTTLPMAASGGDETSAIQSATKSAMRLAAPRNGRARGAKVVFAVVPITRVLRERW